VKGDSAVDVAQSTSLESSLKDPTPEKHLVCAIRCIGRLAQNIAGGKSLEGLYSALRACIVDNHNDPDLQQWADGYLAFAKRALEQMTTSRMRSRTLAGPSTGDGKN
jgi:hypothetical protein